MSDNIKIKFVEQLIRVVINEPSPIRIKIREGIQGATGTTGAASSVPGTTGAQGTTGETGTTGAMGVTDHALLSHLGYANSGHTGFQKELIYIPDFKAYEI